MLELPLPEINMARVHIVFDDQVSHANAAALTFGEDHWRKVEAPFLAGERPLQHGALPPWWRCCLQGLSCRWQVQLDENCWMQGQVRCTREPCLHRVLGCM